MSKEEEKKILVVLRKKTCDMHVKLFGGYYEGVIQARGPDKEEILEQVKKLVPPKALIGIETLKEGYNINTYIARHSSDHSLCLPH